MRYRNLMNHASRMATGDAAQLVIDVQEKLLPLIHAAAVVERNIAFLLDAAQLFHVPVAAVEQYPKGLGPTVPELGRRLRGKEQTALPDKVAFSSCAVESVVDGFHRDARTRIVLAGIESHVCVLHT